MNVVSTDKDFSYRIFEKLSNAGVTLFTYVPDLGNANIIKIADDSNETTAILLSSEDEGVAICAGADLAGRRSVLLMQSSGVGNCPNILSLIKSAGFPLLMIVTMRGDYGEQNPWQYPMGEAVEPILTAMGVQTIWVNREDELDAAIDASLSAVFKGGQGVALIISQKFLGAKEF